jgi:hypothetical protein
MDNGKVHPFLLMPMKQPVLDHLPSGHFQVKERENGKKVLTKKRRRE